LYRGECTIDGSAWQQIKADVANNFGSAKHSIAEDSKGHMERLELSKYEQAADFLQIDVAILMTENLLQLPSWWGIEVQFRNYQIVKMVDLYIQELSDANGGILANIMGLGKTRTIVGMMTISQAHLLLWIDYTNHLNDPTSTRHLRPEETDTPDRALKPCPGKTDCGIPCVCSPSSPLCQKALRLAPTLVTGYRNAVDQWGKEITKVLGGTRWLIGATLIRLYFLTSNLEKNMIEYVKV
jgi:SNF2 family DNA or RNA helicase